MLSHAPDWPHPWPVELGPNTPVHRARTYARAAVTALLDPSVPGPVAAEAILTLARNVGDVQWLQPPPPGTGPAPGERLTRDQLAGIAEVRTDAVRLWGSRGLSRGGERRHLRADPVDQTYDPDEAAAFLRWRDTTERQETTPCP